MMSNQEIEEDRLAAAKKIDGMIADMQAQHPLSSITREWQKRIMDMQRDNQDRKELERLRGIVDKTDLLKSQLETAKRSENMHRDFCDKLRKEVAALKAKKEDELTTKAYQCPYCREFINMQGSTEFYKDAHWHRACYYKSRRNRRVARVRRRARRWRNFKLFLSRAFWSIW